LHYVFITVQPEKARLKDSERDARRLQLARSGLREKGVWAKISNALKRLDFWSHNFLAQLRSETSRACTIRVSTIKFREALE
jgi:hypothetical protein